jgi:hypothetical protein
MSRRPAPLPPSGKLVSVSPEPAIPATMTCGCIPATRHADVLDRQRSGSAAQARTLAATLTPRRSA